MQEAYLKINGVPTKVCTWGRWVEEPKSNTNEIAIIIPGNPGIPGFYEDFAKRIYEKLEIPVWCVGHAGHNVHDNVTNVPLPPFLENKDLYGLRGQVQHKLDFFERYVPKDAKVHLIGHSIGCYTILEILDHPAVKDKVVDVDLMFPAIEHMAATSNGKFMSFYIKYIVGFIVLLSWIFTLLPAFIQYAGVYIYAKITNIPIEKHYNNIHGLVNPKVLRRVFFFAFEELDDVLERNNEAIRNNISKIKLLYGYTDGWAPASTCDRLKVDFPAIDARLTKINHAFVLNKSEEVADIVINWIRPNSQ